MQFLSFQFFYRFCTVFCHSVFPLPFLLRIKILLLIKIKLILLIPCSCGSWLFSSKLFLLLWIAIYYQQIFLSASASYYVLLLQARTIFLVRQGKLPFPTSLFLYLLVSACNIFHSWHKLLRFGREGCYRNNATVDRTDGQ